MKVDIMHWLWHIIIGGLLIAVGAFSTSLGWHSISQWRIQVGWTLPIIKKKRRKCFDVCCVVFGLILVGVGAPWTTYGWNLRDNQLQKEALVIACIREWKLNNSFLPRCYFNITDEAKLSEHYSYPRFQLNSMQVARTSALFDINNPKDFKLVQHLVAYEYFTILLQEFLDLTDEGLYVAFAGRKPSDEHKRVNNSEYVILFLRSHRELGKLLKEEYYSAYKKALRILPEKIK